MVKLDPTHYERATAEQREAVLRAALQGYHVRTLLGARSHVSDQRDLRFRDEVVPSRTRGRIQQRWASEAEARAKLAEVRAQATAHVLQMPRKKERESA